MPCSIFLASIGQSLVGILMFLTALFLILLVLIQRGRGGGLAGAFGGMGGQSAFGAKAGDTFTKVTIVAAAFWILLCMVAVKFMGDTPSAFGENEGTKPVFTGSSGNALDGSATEDGAGLAEAEGTTGDSGDSPTAETTEETR